MKKEILSNTLRNLLSNTSPIELEAYVQSFRRNFTLKDCLPELPAKTFYQWVEEGLIPKSFGKDKTEFIIEQAGVQREYRKWSRYHLYEFVWIRLVFHLRKMGFPKEFISQNARNYFSLPDAELIQKIAAQFEQNAIELEKAFEKLKKDLGSKAAKHEVGKITNALTETLCFGVIHEAVFTALVGRTTLLFLCFEDGLIIPCISKSEQQLEKLQLLSHVTVPFLRLLNDLIECSDPEFLKTLMRLNEIETDIIRKWKADVSGTMPNNSIKGSGRRGKKTSPIQLDPNETTYRIRIITEYYAQLNFQSRITKIEDG